jgi:antitoxin component of MazEF toxin-antitoxin module
MSNQSIIKMETEVIIRKWGNSLGVILPKELVEKEGLKENKKVIVHIVKKADISHLFGLLERKMSGQKFKDMVREGWDSP